MNLNKKIKSIVITYEDMECVRLSDQEAEKFRELISEFVSVYHTSLLSSSRETGIDLDNYFQYEIIRPALSESDIEVRS